jgi:PAS domain S-box-containing protein
MFPHLLHPAPGAVPVFIALSLFIPRSEFFLALLALAALLIFVFLQHHWYKRARALQASRHALGKCISEFVERLAVSPLDLVDTTIVEGLNNIVSLVDTDRICWYEVAEDSSALLHKYTASARPTPLSPKFIPPDKMPAFAERLSRHEVVVLETLKDLPPGACGDSEFLRDLGVKSLLLIPSSYSPARKGVLGIASYSVEVSWSEESINQLAIAANIIGATLERKYAQTAGQESEGRFRYLFAQASIGIALETMEGRILDVNPAFCSMIGYSLEELQSSTCAQFSHPDDEEIERILFDELRQGLRSSYRIEKRFFRKDGSEMWGQVSVSLLYRNHGTDPLVIGMVSDVTAQKTAEASLHQRDQELQRLAGRLIEAQEDERRRISRELHDDIGQRVSLLACELDPENTHNSAAPRERESALLCKLHKELDAIATDIHELSHELHSASLQCSGLKLALEDLCWKYSHNHHLQIDLHTEELNATLPPEVALCLFRVAQEALANALKHGRTKQVLVRMTQDSDKVRLTIKDFGAGFDCSSESTGIGLMSMRERLRLCAGSLSVSSAPNQGTEISAEVPSVKRLVATA